MPPFDRGSGSVSTDAVNYFSIHGTTPGDAVAGKSTLAAEVTQYLLNASLNLRSECLVPAAFIGFRGGNGQAVVTNNTENYSLSFG